MFAKKNLYMVWDKTKGDTEEGYRREQYPARRWVTDLASIQVNDF